MTREHRRPSRGEFGCRASILGRSVWPLLVLAMLLLCCREVLGQETFVAPDIYFLGIGVEHYEDPSIPPIENTAQDIGLLQEAIRLQRDRFYGDVHTEGIVDEAATREGICNKIKQFFATMRPQDMAIIYVALHGVVKEVTGEHFFLPSDARLEAIDETALEQGQMLELLRDVLPPEGRLLLLADTLRDLGPEQFMSTFGRENAYAWGEPAPLEEVCSPLPRGWQQYDAGGAVTLPKAATPPLPPPPGVPVARGAFVQTLLEVWYGAWADVNNDGLISFNEFHDFVTERVQVRTGGCQLPDASGALPSETLTWAPGQKELCNQIDDNHDGRIDEGFDQDGDGYSSLALCPEPFGTDCDDEDPSVHPNQPDLWTTKPQDDDCDGQKDEDEPDLDDDGVPDPWQQYRQRLRLSKWGTMLTGAALVCGSVVAYSSLQTLMPENDQDYLVYPDKTTVYKRLSYVSAAGGALGVVSISFSGTFAFRQLRFEAKYMDLGRRRTRHQQSRAPQVR